MVSSIIDSACAALIAPTYHTTIKVLDDDTLFANIRAIHDDQVSLAIRPHRPAGTAVSDFMHEHFTWDLEPNPDLNLLPRLRSEFKIINDMGRDKIERDEIAQEIRYFAQQKGNRVPDKEEVCAMAWLVNSAKGVVRE
jgi:hypothetical protein